MFPGGAFGDVYDLVAVNGTQPPARQIVKVLRDNGQGSDQKGFETIEKLQRRIVEVNQHRATSSRLALQELPALRALPQFSFRGRMGNLPVCGYSAERLDTAGYLPFSAFLDVDEDPRPRERYVQELGMDDRLLLAHELAEGFDALHELWYIHGDLNPPNLFVNVAERHVAIIDFDSGAVTDASDESPSIGRLAEAEWLAPEIMEQMLKNRTQRAIVQVTQFTDNWAVAVGIHYLLFLCGPFFLLDRPNTHNIRDYAARHGWPRYDPADPLFAPGMENSYAIFTELLQEVPAEVIRRMRDAMTVGVEAPERRPTYYQWTAALSAGRTRTGVRDQHAGGSVDGSAPAVPAGAVDGEAESGRGGASASRSGPSVSRHPERPGKSIIIGVSGVNSGFTPEFDRVHTLELGPRVPDCGELGDVYSLTAVNGAPPRSRQIVKVLRDNGFDSVQRGLHTLGRLQERVAARNLERRAARQRPLQTIPALRALPQFSFRGSLDGAEVAGYCAERLDVAGFAPFENYLGGESGPEWRDRYVALLTLHDRLAFARDLAEGFQELSRLSYVHGDLNPRVISLNEADRHLVVTSFDHGVVADDPDECLVFGRLVEGEWLAPEVWEQYLAQWRPPVTASVNRLMDGWAVAVAIHYLLFLCGPYFFLTRPSRRNVRHYLARNRWPEIDVGDPLFARGLEGAYATYAAMLRDLPAAVLARLADSFNEGAFLPHQRVTPHQWLAILKPFTRPARERDATPPPSHPGQGAARADAPLPADRAPIEVSPSVREIERPSAGAVGGSKPLEALASAPAAAPRGEPENDCRSVFIGYNRADRRWLRRVENHLKVMNHPARLVVWDDSRIGGALGWRDRVEQATRSATAAVLLVSADFLRTDFEHDFELLRVLLNAEGEGTVILPVIVSACKYEETPWLERLPPVNEPQRPVDSLPKGKQEQVFLELARHVDRVLHRAG